MQWYEKKNFCILNKSDTSPFCEQNALAFFLSLANVQTSSFQPNALVALDYENVLVTHAPGDFAYKLERSSTSYCAPGTHTVSPVQALCRTPLKRVQ